MQDQIPMDVDAEIFQLFDIAQRLLAAHNAFEKHLGGRLPDSPRDSANMMLALRGVEFAFAATDNFFHNRPVAGAAVGRALLETAVTLRWCLQSEENGRRWWLEGDKAIQTSLRALGLSSDPSVIAFRDGPRVGVGLPSFQKRAQQGGLGKPYQRWYRALSNYVHPSRMSTAHTYARRGEKPAPPLVMPCIYFADDIGAVFTSWAYKRVIPEPAEHP